MWAWMPTYLGVVLAHGRDSNAGMASLGIAFAALSYLISTAGSIGGGCCPTAGGARPRFC